MEFKIYLFLQLLTGKELHGFCNNIFLLDEFQVGQCYWLAYEQYFQVTLSHFCLLCVFEIMFMKQQIPCNSKGESSNKFSCKVIFVLDYKRALYIQEEMSCWRVERTLTKVNPQKKISKLSFAPDSDPELDPPDIDESAGFGIRIRFFFFFNRFRISQSMYTIVGHIRICNSFFFFFFFFFFFPSLWDQFLQIWGIFQSWAPFLYLVTTLFFFFFF